jgi:putative resolvase
VPAERVGRLILVKTTVASTSRSDVVVYARVSSYDQRSDLDRQVARLTVWASAQDLLVGQVVCEVGSGLNGKRPKLRRVLSDPDAKVIVVEHRDRLARFGGNTSRRRWRRRADGSWWPTPARPPMI